MIERQATRRPDARRLPGGALDIFDRLGAPLWADKARRELAKVVVRTPMDGLA